jgi:hypothetical protein
MTEPKFPFLLPTDEKKQEVEDAYDRAVGRVSRTWNRLHQSLGAFFAVVIGGNIELVLAAWDSIENDRTKREMLRATIKAASQERWPERWKQTPKAPDDLLWVLKRADALSEVRNDAMHALVALHIGAEATMAVTSPSSRGKRERKLWDNERRGRKLLDEFAKCERDSEALSAFVGEAFSALYQLHGRKWPSRPEQIWAAPKQ